MPQRMIQNPCLDDSLFTTLYAWLDLEFHRVDTMSYNYFL